MLPQFCKLISIAVIFLCQTALGDTIQGRTMVKYFYQIVLDSSGEPYLDAEQQLIAQGTSVIPFLQEQIKNAAPLPKLITQVILERINGNESFKACLDYLDQAEQRTAQTPLRVPPPEGVANYLVQHFGNKVSSLLGVYLVKLGHIWPGWKTLGVILYLGKLDSTASAEALIRFLSVTTNENYRKVAIESLVAVGDKSVLNKLATELNGLTAIRDGLQQATDRIKNKESLKP
jgi:hypothetical protein